MIFSDIKVFDWNIEFSEVMDRGGFDVIIGNPPYMRVQGIRNLWGNNIVKKYKDQFESAYYLFDLYVLFMERGLEILNESGTLCYIVPDKWTHARFGKGIRGVITKGNHAQKMISLGKHKLFDVSTYSSLIWITKQPNEHLNYLDISNHISSKEEMENVLNSLQAKKFNSVESEALDNDNWILTNREVGSVLNKLGEQTRCLAVVFERIFVGLQTSKNAVYVLNDCVSSQTFVEGYSKALKEHVKIEAALMQPMLKGSNVHRYTALKANNFVVFPYIIEEDDNTRSSRIMSPDYVQENFPLGWEYLKRCEDIIKSREGGKTAQDEAWYRYIYPKNAVLFEAEKLVSPDISLGGNFAYDQAGEFYMTTTVYGYIKRSGVREGYKFWLALMNSKLLWFYLKNIGTVLTNGYFRYTPDYLKKFPVPEVVSTDQEEMIIRLAEYVSFIKANMDTKSAAHARDAVMLSFFEQIIDALIYELYFSDELKQYNREILCILRKESLPIVNNKNSLVDQIKGLRLFFEGIFDKEHELRRNIFYLDSLPTIRIIENDVKYI